MALLESEFQFTGSLGNLSAYRMRGVDKIVVRKKAAQAGKGSAQLPNLKIQDGTTANSADARSAYAG